MGRGSQNMLYGEITPVRETSNNRPPSPIFDAIPLRPSLLYGTQGEWFVGKELEDRATRETLKDYCGGNGVIFRVDELPFLPRPKNQDGSLVENITEDYAFTFNWLQTFRDSLQTIPEDQFQIVDNKLLSFKHENETVYTAYNDAKALKELFPEGYWAYGSGANNTGSGELFYFSADGNPNPAGFCWCDISINSFTHLK